MDSQVDRTRPIIGIESRTAQEVFDIMCDRIRSASLALPKVESDPWSAGVEDSDGNDLITVSADALAGALAALKAAQALATCCMAQGCYSHDELAEMALVTAPTFSDAIRTLNTGGTHE